MQTEDEHIREGFSEEATSELSCHDGWKFSREEKCMGEREYARWRRL